MSNHITIKKGCGMGEFEVTINGEPQKGVAGVVFISNQFSTVVQVSYVVGELDIDANVDRVTLGNPDTKKDNGNGDIGGSAN